MNWTRASRLLPALALGALALAGCSDNNNDSGTNPTAPAAPTAVAATSPSTTSVQVSWTPGSRATSQRVELKEGGTLVDSESFSDNTTASHSFSSLTENTTYTAQVFAINSVGETASATVNVTTGQEETSVVISGVIDQNTTLTADKTWILDGPVFVGVDCGPDPAAPLASCIAVDLTIEPGTTIVGRKQPTNPNARSSFLVVTRGSRILADATGGASRPTEAQMIVMTSDQPRGQRARGDWGGLVLNGRAPINSGDEASGEGGSGLFGGVDDNDDSGILRGVRVEFAGDAVTTTDELNGIALQGTGAGTTLDYVQVAYNVDDGTEPFGGSATQTHMVMTGIGDDSFDGTDGYRGFMQFLIAQQRGDDADQGFELSTNGDNGAASPQSTAVIANATLVGARDGAIGALGTESDDGIQLREGSNYRIFNTIVTNFDETGLCFEGAVTTANADNALAGETEPSLINVVQSTILWSNGPTGSEDLSDGCGGGYDIATYFNNAGWNNMVADPNLPASALDIGSLSSPPNVISTGMPAGYVPFDVSVFNNEGGTGIIMPTDGRTLQATNYAGAVEPGTALADAWYYGWTVWSTDGSDSRPNQDGQ